MTAIKNVLVTGYDGYIGTPLVAHLLARGYEVTGLDTGYYDTCWFGTPHQIPRVLRVDCRDVTPENLAGFDAVIHLAALSNDPLGQLSEDLTLGINYRASVRLAALAKTAGVRRFLYASSCSLYGKSDTAWVDERSPMVPITAYAKSKVLVEEALATLADETFCPVILRCATVFGVSPKLRLDLVVNNLAAWGIATGKIRLHSDGTPWRPLIHVEDLVAAYETLLRLPCAPGDVPIMNVGFNAHNYQVRTIAEQVAAALPGTEVVCADTPDRDSRSYRVRFDLFASRTGLAPRWSLETGIRQLCEAYRAEGITADDLSGRRYIRLNQIRHLLQRGWLDATLRWQRPDAATTQESTASVGSVQP